MSQADEHGAWLRSRLGRAHSRFQTTFQGDVGRSVLRDILKECGIGKTAIVAGDPYATYGNAKKQEVGLRILRIMNMTEEEAMQIAVERDDDD